MQKLRWLFFLWMLLVLAPNSYGVILISEDPLVTKQKQEAEEESTEEAEEPEDSVANGEAKVYHVEGKAFILKHDGETWVELQVEDVVEVDDQIRTETNASVEIYYDEFYLNTMTIQENTIADIRSLEPTDIYLSEGSILSDLGELLEDSDYQITTPASVAAVRGTQFIREYDPKTGNDGTHVLEGFIDLNPIIDGEVLSGTAETIQIAESQSVAFAKKAIQQGNFSTLAPKKLPPDRRRHFNQTVKHSRKRLENFAGGPQVIARAKNNWQQVKRSPEKMQKVGKRLEKGRQQYSNQKLGKDRGPGAGRLMRPKRGKDDDRKAGPGGPGGPGGPSGPGNLNSGPGQSQGKKQGFGRSKNDRANQRGLGQDRNGRDNRQGFGRSKDDFRGGPGQHNGRDNRQGFGRSKDDFRGGPGQHNGRDNRQGFGRSKDDFRGGPGQHNGRDNRQGFGRSKDDFRGGPGQHNGRDNRQGFGRSKDDFRGGPGQHNGRDNQHGFGQQHRGHSKKDFRGGPGQHHQGKRNVRDIPQQRQRPEKPQQMRPRGKGPGNGPQGGPRPRGGGPKPKR